MAGRERFLRKLTLEFFQSWRKRTTFYFGSGITGLAGPSDAGKSAILRSFEWLTENEAGTFEDEVLTWGSKRKDVCYVCAEFNDGVIVERLRSLGGINEYRLNGETFKALRGQVPPEIKKALGMGAINYQPQDQAYFLIDKPSGVVAKELNQIADLAGADIATTNINKRVKSTEKRIKQSGKDIKSKQSEITELDYVSDCDLMLEGLEEKDADIKVIGVDISRLEDHCSSLITTKNGIAALPETDEVMKGIGKLEALQRRVEKSNEQVHVLDRSLECLVEAQNALDMSIEIDPDFYYDCDYMTEKYEGVRKAKEHSSYLSTVVKRLIRLKPKEPEFNVADFEKAVEKVGNAHEFLTEAEKAAEVLKAAVNRIRNIGTAMGLLKDSAEEARKSLMALEATVDRCSECGRILNEDCCNG